MTEKKNHFTEEPLSSGERSPEDGKLFYRCWKASGESKAVLIYLHGVQSHSGWLNQFGENLSSKGIDVYAPDRRGSGQSGFLLGEISDYRVLLRDVSDFIDFVREHEPNKEVHLAGLCWGARLCLPLCADPAQKIASVILVSPGLYAKVDYSFTEKIAIGWARLISPNKKFSLPLEDSYFTQNPRFLNFIKEDPYSLRQVSARFLIETLKLNALAIKSLNKVSIPLLVLLAGEDQIVDTDRSFQVFSKLKLKEKEIKIYPTMRHTLEFEEENNLFFEDVTRWVTQRKQAFEN